MIKAVIIDFDDTLCLTEEACFYMENEVLGRMGRKPMTRQAHRANWGIPTLEAIKARSPGVDVEEFHRVMQTVMPAWVASKKLDAVDPINLAALDVLTQQGKRLYILTSRPAHELEHILAPDHDLASRITTFYYRDVMEFHKPDPRAFDLLLKDHRFERHECVYVGDSLSDAIAAKQAHLHFIASMESGIRAENDFRELDVDLFIQKFADLPSAVEFLDGQ